MSILAQYADILQSRDSPPPPPRPPSAPANGEESPLDEEAHAEDQHSRKRPFTALSLPAEGDPICIQIPWKKNGHQETVHLDWNREVGRWLRERGGTAGEATDGGSNSSSGEDEAGEEGDAPHETELDEETAPSDAHADPLSSRKHRGKPKASKQLRWKEDDLYDYDDEFIDDEEDYFAEQLMFKPKVDGFFAWRGAVPSLEISEQELFAKHQRDEEQAEVRQKQMRRLHSVNDKLKKGGGSIPAKRSPVKKPASVEVPVKKPVSVEVGSVSNAEQAAPPAPAPPAARKKKKSTLDDAAVSDPMDVDEPKKKKVKREPTAPVFAPLRSTSSMDDFETPPPQPSRSVSPVKAPIVAEDGVSVPAPVAAAAVKKPVAKKPLLPLPEPLQPAMDALKVAVTSVELQKGKFPVVLKEPLLVLAQAAVQHYGGEWNALHADACKSFWAHLKELFGYQPSTLKKIVDRQLLPTVVHAKELELQQQYLQFAGLAEKAAEQTEKWFQNRMEKWTRDHPGPELNPPQLEKVEGTKERAGRSVESILVENAAVIVVEDEPPTASPNENLQPASTVAMGMAMDVVNEQTAVEMKLGEKLAENQGAAPAPQPMAPSPTAHLQDTTAPSSNTAAKKDLPPVKKLQWNADFRLALYQLIQAETKLIPIRRRLNDVGGLALECPPVQYASSNVHKEPLALRLFHLEPSPTSADPSLPETSLRRNLFAHVLDSVLLPICGPTISMSEVSRQWTLSRTREEGPVVKKNSPTKPLLTATGTEGDLAVLPPGKKRESKKKTIKAVGMATGTAMADVLGGVESRPSSTTVPMNGMEEEEASSSTFMASMLFRPIVVEQQPAAVDQMETEQPHHDQQQHHDQQPAVAAPAAEHVHFVPE